MAHKALKFNLTILFPITIQFLVSRKDPQNGMCLAVGHEGNLRGVVTFPLPESRSRPTRSAAHAPGAPWAPVPVHMFRDGRLAHTLPSPTPLKHTKGPHSAKPLVPPTDCLLPFLVSKIHFEISTELEYFRVCMFVNTCSTWCL